MIKAAVLDECSEFWRQKDEKARAGDRGIGNGPIMEGDSSEEQPSQSKKEDDDSHRDGTPNKTAINLENEIPTNIFVSVHKDEGASIDV